MPTQDVNATDTAAPTDTVSVYRYDETRKYIPPAGLAAQGKVAEQPKTRFNYDPHLPPVLRFSDNERPDSLPEPLQEVLEKAQKEPLTEKEVRLLAAALQSQPWLEWTGKREKHLLEVDPVALHIHERVSAEAIIAIARRQDIQRSLFADPEMEYREAVKFYQHDMDWANRMILGDNLLVMNSLAKREDMAGTVQMIYIDPPYGIKFSSNFQPFVNSNDVRDRNQDLTREPEQVKAYRDTWTLGIHSYLTYLRDRLIVARQLLKPEGSIFVQISDENVHRVRILLDEVFGSENFVSLITYKTTQSAGAKTLDTTSNYLLWYAQNIDRVKFHSLFKQLTRGEKGATRYEYVENQNSGECRRLTPEEHNDDSSLSQAWRFYTDQGLTSRGKGSDATMSAIEFQDESYSPTVGHWRTTADRIMGRIIPAERVTKAGMTIRFKKYFDDFGFQEITNLWDDVGGGIQSRTDPKIYVVQTSNSVIQRCLLMTTDPGDLVLDPTCGSGTTAYVAEQWGRRWITIDTSRVALALARQRILTAKFDYFEMAEPSLGLSRGFIYETAPHVFLYTIAHCDALDSILPKWKAILDEKLEILNAALLHVTPSVRAKLKQKLDHKERNEGRKAISDADRRRWSLAEVRWKEWEVPFDTDPDWPEELAKALWDYRSAWQQKMSEVNATIAASAPQEVLVDRPKVSRNIVRVSGPFTVEGIQPLEESDTDASPIGDLSGELEAFVPDAWSIGQEPVNAEAHIEAMVRLLRKDGIRFPDNRHATFNHLELLTNSILHGEGEWDVGNQSRRVAVSLGPQYGPVTALQVEESLRAAYRQGYDDLIFAGFTVDGAAQAVIQEDPNPKVRCHLAFISPDVHMRDLLTETTSSQLFSVFGLPRAKLEQNEENLWIVEMEGVDIYDPITNTVNATRADKIAGWFLDSDYDGGTFCITQAFFPDPTAWDKLARALRTVMDTEGFALLSGKRSMPFAAGKHKRAAIKVIDPRGNEVMRILHLSTGATHA